MAFNINKFETTTFDDRVAVVPVPELKDFFDEKDKPEWTVRGLTGPELAVVNEAVSANNNMEGIVNAIASQLKSDKVSASKEILGLVGDSVPNDLVRRFSMLVQGSVEPKCPQSVAVKIGEAFPTILFKLTNKIIELTGEGKLGESKPCGKPKKSK